MPDTGFIGPIVKLTNDTCVPVRFAITDADKHKVEAILMDTLSLVPGIDKLFNVMTVKGIITNSISIAADITGLAVVQDLADFLNVEKPKEGLIYPKESIERRAAANGVLNRNQVKVEYLTFNDSKTTIYLTTFGTSALEGTPGSVKELKLSAILKEKTSGKRPEPVTELPSPWNSRKVLSISMELDNSCLKNWRLLRIPRLRLVAGACTVSTLKDRPSVVDGVFCPTKVQDDSQETYPYTFTGSQTDGTTLGRWDSKNSMIFFDGPQGRPGGCGARLINNCIPAVALYHCNIKREGKGDESADVEGKKTEAAVLSWLWDRIKDRKEHDRMVTGHKYWAISWDGSSKVYSLETDADSNTLASYILVKKRNYMTYMVSDCWKALS